MLQRFLLLWLVLSSFAAYFWPSLWSGVSPRMRLESAAAFDPFRWIFDAGCLNPAIQAAMFSIGCLLPRDEVAQVFRQWRLVLGGTAVQYAAMPTLAFLACQVFPLDESARLGVIFVGCVPGAMASNVLTLAARGNVSYSVSLTTASTLLSPLAVPAALWLTLGSSTRIDPLQAGLDLVTLVVGPVVLGYLLCRAFSRIERPMQVAAPVAANLVILLIIAVVVGINRDRLAHVTGYVLAALLVVNLLGYAAGYGGAKLYGFDTPMRRALTLEVGMQNAGLGTVLVTGMFKDRPEAAIPTAAYTFGCMLTGTILAQLWSRRAPSGEERRGRRDGEMKGWSEEGRREERRGEEGAGKIPPQSLAES